MLSQLYLNDVYAPLTLYKVSTIWDEFSVSNE